jgi:hypothetical protein
MPILRRRVVLPTFIAIPVGNTPAVVILTLELVEGEGTVHSPPPWHESRPLARKRAPPAES